MNDFDKTKEKRKHPRKEIITNMTYREYVPSGEEGIIQDISEGGLCLELNKEFSPGTILEVKYELPGLENKPIVAFARVVWQKKSGKRFHTGVKFITL